MVQTKEQEMFCYLALLEAAEREGYEMNEVDEDEEPGFDTIQEAVNESLENQALDSTSCDVNHNINNNTSAVESKADKMDIEETQKKPNKSASNDTNQNTNSLDQASTKVIKDSGN